jgi:cell division septation protein DedD
MELEDKSKLFVFEKKEVILIFVFVLVITVTAFTLGVKVGKNIFLESVGVTKPDVDKTITLKSVEEESADSLTDDLRIEDSLTEIAKEDLSESGLEEKLKKEFSEVAGKKETKDPVMDEPLSEPVSNIVDNTSSGIDTEMFVDGDANAGKYTIQLVSLETKFEAEKYAEPFVAANYTVVINRANVPGKGTWYRVGIGLFESQSEAKEYLSKEKSLFRGKRYLINQIK